METQVKEREGVAEIRKVSSQLIEIDICILKSGLNLTLLIGLIQSI